MPEMTSLVDRLTRFYIGGPWKVFFEVFRILLFEQIFPNGFQSLGDFRGQQYEKFLPSNYRLPKDTLFHQTALFEPSNVIIGAVLSSGVKD